MKADCTRRALFLLLAVSMAPILPVAAQDKTGEMLKEPTDEKPRKFIPATKAEADDAIARAKIEAEATAEILKIKIATLETEHFLIFTDWDSREYGFLKSNMEGAYDAVAKQFNVSRRENVFAGKLPVYMFAKHSTFKDFAAKRDRDPVPDGVLGYFRPTKGNGYMAMWKPAVKAQTGGVVGAQVDWGSTLVHEFTHAFLARYRSNGRIPLWLNEGIAEVIADSQFHRPGVRNYVRSRFKEGKTRVGEMLKEDWVMKGEDYPVAQTMVETLAIGNRKGFVEFVNDVKDGVSVEDSLKKHYKVDHNGFVAAWKKYIQ